MEAARRLKANPKIQGQPCGACETPFELGDDVSICSECEAAHHTACWDERGGCSTAACANAPLEKLAPEPAAASAGEAKPGYKRCPACQRNIPETDEICMYCRAIATPDGVYRGPRENAPGATASLVFGILGLFLCGIIFGILAINKSKEARLLIASDPRLGGEGMAKAGLVLGIIDVVLWGLVIIARIGGAMQ